jgi:DNA uptake protein ComE-like DNA-binding protein
MKRSSFFNVSRNNKKGIILLSLITLVIIFTPRILSLLNFNSDFDAESFPVENWNTKSFERKTEFKSFKSKKSYNSRYSIPTQKFDPNQYSQSDWMKLGLSIKQANVVLKFTKRGIYSNEDLKKIFVIPDDLFELIKDSTFYPDKLQKDFTAKFEKIEVKKELLEINSATEEQLIEIKGIGNFFAKQIIKKREELGGFYNKSQLMEVWKMDEEKFGNIESSIYIDSKLIKKISINDASIDELKKHPYIRWNIANSIVKMREQKKGFRSIEELKESVIITEEKFQKIKPYISL